MLFSSQIRDLKKFLPWVRIRREQSSLRTIMEQRRRLLSAQDIREQSDLIIARIEQLPAFRTAQTVLLYYPIHHEVDLLPLLAKYEGQKTFLFPVTHRRYMEVRPYDGEEKMSKGHFGIPEPQTATYHGPIDLILVPGVVFDHRRHRIGRGGGYYDRFLSKHSKTPKIGVCYAFQLYQQDIPHLWRDQKMDCVITPQLTIG